ncbi:unnamed protein product, partial [Allacma fusca]
MTFKGEKPFEFLENTNHEESVKVEEEGSTTSTSVDIFNPDSALNVDETAALCSQSMKMLLRPEESEKPPEAVSKWEEIIAGTPPEEHSDGQDTKPLIKTEADGDANSDIFDIICEHDDYEVYPECSVNWCLDSSRTSHIHDCCGIFYKCTHVDENSRPKIELHITYFVPTLYRNHGIIVGTEGQESLFHMSALTFNTFTVNLHNLSPTTCE